MGAVAARIEPKVAVWTFDGAWGDGRATIGGQRPGVGHLSAAERAAQAVGPTQPQRGGLTGQQVGLLVRGQRLHPRPPPVPGGCDYAEERPSQPTRQPEAPLSCVHPDAPGAPGQEAQCRQSDCKKEAVHQWVVYPHSGRLSSRCISDLPYNALASII